MGWVKDEGRGKKEGDLEEGEVKWTLWGFTIGASSGGFLSSCGSYINKWCMPKKT